MTDWSTIASLSTAGGTLVLAAATFTSVRASQRSARIAEQALLIGQRPVLGPGREDDPPITVSFADSHFVTVPGGGASVERVDGRYYFVVQLRNVGSGIAVLHSWRIVPEGLRAADPELDGFRRQTRDLYIPAGHTGFWQAALREPDDAMRAPLDEIWGTEAPIIVDLLYGDHEGGQRAVSRFSIWPTGDGRWLPGISRHFRLDGVSPRD
jgi:hypothetical protein